MMATQNQQFSLVLVQLLQVFYTIYIIYLTNTRLHAIKSIEPVCSAALALKAK